MPSDNTLAENSLVLYKSRPARITRMGDKIDIELESGETIRVRPKDVTLLHPGPLPSLGELRNQEGEVYEAWEILAGSKTTLRDLAELAYGEYTPATAWAAWQIVADGLYFRGDADEVVAASPEEVEQKRAARAAEAAERQAWQAFLARLRGGKYAPEDARYLKDVEMLALGRTAHSRVLHELGREETAENAHALLLDIGFWSILVNPYPARMGLPNSAPDLPVPPLPEEERLDLTHLAAFAIDDEDTDTPDDAISLEGHRLWVHVADVAALVPPDSALDIEARARGATVHLPEGNAPMFPWQVVERLGLGLGDVSPALSFGLTLDADGQLIDCQIAPSCLRVTRLTYEEAEARLDADHNWQEMLLLTTAHKERRSEQGAVMLDFPEVKVKVKDGSVTLRPLPALRSRALVEEAMIMAGEAVAQMAIERSILLPFATQEPNETNEHPDSLSGMFALRRTLKHSQYRSGPAPHGGLGLPAYTQVTSPLRRYLDLVAHQQLREYLRGGPQMDAQQITERVGATEAVQQQRASDGPPVDQALDARILDPASALAWRGHSGRQTRSEWHRADPGAGP